VTKVEGRFKGFPAEAFDFFKKLSRHNNREWFLKNKVAYQESLLEPMKRLVEDVDEELRKQGIPLRRNARSSVQRIYRDIRFSADKTPYYTFIAAAFYFEGDKSRPGVLYIHFDNEHPFFAAGFWHPDAQFLTALRTKLGENPEAFEKVLKKLERAGYEFSQEGSLSRMPRGFERFADSPLAKFFKMKSFVVSERLETADLYKKNLITRITSFTGKALPLLEFGWALQPPETSDFQDV